MAEIIIVDDLVANRRIFRLLLEHRRHRVVEAASIDEAFHLLEHSATPDAAIFDLHLGDESGVNLLRRLRADPVFGPLPVLFASAEPQREAIVSAAGLGIVGFLSKPVDSARFQQAVEGAVAAKWMSKLFRDPDEWCLERGLDRTTYQKTAVWFFAELGKAVAAAQQRSDPAKSVSITPIGGLESTAGDLGLSVFVQPLAEWRAAGERTTPPPLLTRVPALARLFHAFTTPD